MARRGNKYKGPDRKILQKLDKAFAMAVARDVKARGTAPTQAISTRLEMFPVSDPAITDALNLIRSRITANLALQWT